MGSPLAFFQAARDEYIDPPVWTGELYLEFHRGTYTSHARVKRGNRRSEHLLREAELWATQATVRTGAAYPYDELERMWHTVLLNQFHDILPGSSIAWVSRVAEEEYAQVERDLDDLIGSALSRLGDGDAVGVANAGPFARRGVAPGAVGTGTAPTPAAVTREGDRIVLHNEHARFEVDGSGRVVSAVHLPSGREAVPPGQYLAELQLFRDTPRAWDAWDIDVDYRKSQSVLAAPTSVDIDAATVVVVHHVGSSRIEMRLLLPDDAPILQIETLVEWHERQRLLKLAFPVDVHTDRATSEIQFGHIHRPITENTSWDVARFETSAHRWVHVGEAGFGVAIGNDATYGHDVTRQPRTGGGVFVLVRQSLLRAPLFPDPEADQGEHRFTSSVTLGATIADAVREGYRVNLPLRRCSGRAVEPLMTLDNPAIVVEAVKLAEDRSGDVIVRLYEALGGRAAGGLSLGFDAGEIYETDLLERRLPTSTTWSPEQRYLSLRPFQLVTLRVAHA
jgi:alpha-mannosidase